MCSLVSLRVLVAVSVMGSSSPPEDEVEKKRERTKDEVGSGSGTKRKNRSLVWKHYTRTVENEDKCRCHYCGNLMCCKTSSGTTSLWKHIVACNAYKTWSAIKAQTQHILDPEGGEGSLGLSRVCESVFREATNELLVLAELPLAFIESLAWKYFCSKVNLYKPVCRRTATKDIVLMYVEKKTSMMKILSLKKQRVSLTTYIWVAPTTAASYMVITAHFIDEYWKLRKLIIGFKNVADHKGATISSVLLDCLAEWGIEKVFTITVDNATANTSALKRFKEDFSSVGVDALVLGGEFLHLRCCAHIINLVVKDGLHDLDSSVSAIRNAVQYVRGSTNRVKAFDLRVETGKMTRGSLSLDCKTRWNSTYLMLLRALKFRSAFDRMEAEDKFYNDYFQERVDGKKRIGPPTTEDWNSVERLVRFLIIFYNSTLVVSKSNSVSSSKVYNEIVTIERNLIKLSNDFDAQLRIKARAMKDKFDKYWEGVKETNRLLIVASVLDPRNKMKFADMCFEMLYGKDSSESKELHASVISVLNRLFEEYSSRLAPVDIAATSSQSAGTSSQSLQESQDVVAGDMDMDGEMGYERMDFLYKEMASEFGFQDVSNEVDLYLKEKTENPRAVSVLKGTEYDVLGWWRLNSSKFPVLSEIARDVLAMQASPVASESAFNTSGRILELSRSCLTHYMIEVLMCTEQ